MTTKKKTRKSGGLKRLPTSDYTLEWDSSRDMCTFRHKGVGGEIGCGAMDAISVFSKGKQVYVLSVNYPARYACLEVFKGNTGVDRLVFAEPGDIDNIFGRDFASRSPKSVAERLTKELPKS